MICHFLVSTAIMLGVQFLRFYSLEFNFRFKRKINYKLALTSCITTQDNNILFMKLNLFITDILFEWHSLAIVSCTQIYSPLTLEENVRFLKLVMA